MLDLFHIAKPQGCDIQTFYGNGAVSNTANTKSWSKPRGASNIYMMLIGAGGLGFGGSNGGGSGAVTVWYGSALNVPDQLEIFVGARGNNSSIKYRTTTGTPATLIEAGAGVNSSGGTAFTANQFCASGFFQSIAGQNGASANLSASTSTFLSGGTSTGFTVTANYGYQIAANGNGAFQLQPIIVGIGGSGSASVGGIGCGGGAGATAGEGGPGMVLIASW